MPNQQKNKRLFISFSGGETSAYMAQWLMDNPGEYKEIITLFANTGEENEQTLDFIERCDDYFGLNVKWIEVTENGGFKVTDFDKAKRNGEPFEIAIQQYGIPNQMMPHCTRETKLRPMTKYLRSIGWDRGTYDTAIGIRVDEFDRMSMSAKEKCLIYPLISQHPTTKRDINRYWSNMPFRLNLKGYEGNCKWCWKKSYKNLMKIMYENPERFEFPERMEKKYSKVGAAYKRTGRPQRFFRKELTVKDIRDMTRVKYQYVQDTFLDVDLEVSGSCSEHCEIHEE